MEMKIKFCISFSYCFQDSSSVEDIRLADGHSFKEVVIFELKFPTLLIMALKTSCHKSKISQPLDIQNVDTRALAQLSVHEANRWA